MRKITLFICVSLFTILSCNSKSEEAKPPADSTTKMLPAETKPETPVAAMPDQAAMDSIWKIFKTPGDMHKWMEKTNGTWEGNVNQWMDAAAPPMQSKATIIQSSTFGGRYVVSKFSGYAFGEPMQGQSTLAYDNAKKLFVSTWIDNLGTGIVYMSGNYDEKTKTLNLSGYQTDPVTGKDANIREEMTIIDDDSYTMTMFGTGADGKEAKFMEGTYKRKK